jgi:hypothetical protein
LIRNIQIYSTIFILIVSSYNIGNRLIASQEFTSTIEQEQNIDNLDNYVLQGLCKVDDKYLISAYDCNHNNKSIIYILDEGLEKYTIKVLNTYSRVGGITYDPINENIWITDTNGTISAYDKEDILGFHKITESKYKNIYVGKELDNLFGDCSAAYITYNDNKLYIGNFNTRNNTIIKEYNIKEDGMIDTSNYKKLQLTGFVQGITFYENEDKKYLIISSSYGKLFNSKLQIYDFDTFEKVKEINTEKMMEEIIVDEDKLITIYEANAKIYSPKKKNTDIIISDINKILTNK